MNVLLSLLALISRGIGSMTPNFARKNIVALLQKRMSSYAVPISKILPTMSYIIYTLPNKKLLSEIALCMASVSHSPIA